MHKDIPALKYPDLVSRSRPPNQDHSLHEDAEYMRLLFSLLSFRWDIEIDSLINRVAEGHVEEIIFALSSTMEGDTTNFFISRKLADFPVKLSVIARGISVGDELEYTDEVTLGRSILNRTPFGK